MTIKEFFNWVQESEEARRYFKTNMSECRKLLNRIPDSKEADNNDAAECA